MKSERNYPIASVSKKAEAAIKRGHPWIYDTEIKSVAGEWTNGCLTDVVSEKGSYLGTGFVSEKSKIRIRLLSNNANDKFDAAFFKRRLKYALDYRKTVMGDDYSACRLIFGEADGLPGLTVDRYENLLVTQVLSYGMDKIKDVIYRSLYELMAEDGIKIDGIYERNDVAIRELEGLEVYKGWYESDFISPADSVLTEIVENGIKYEVDVENGQKTGFFLDQKYNRRAAASIAKGKNVVDCCTHTGSFALNCAKGGAAHVTAVDVSAQAIEMARSNAELNGLSENMSFVTSDVFDFLKNRIENHDRSADYIILDPPAFTKSRKTVGNAKNGYLELNTLAMRLLPRGGYLATASCSHFMTEELFAQMLRDAARAAGVNLRMIEMRRQAPDHPILMSVDETEYLKFYLLQII